MSTICFESVEKSFSGEPVLSDYNMTVEPASLKIILGGSGSGKSTILKMVLGLVRPDQGRVTVFGNDIGELDEGDLMPIRGRTGMVFQGGALFDSLSVGENVAYRLMEQRRLTEAEIRETVLEVLGFVGLEQTIDKLPSDLSGGMRRRVAIARALVGHPEIMLYDEPTAGLDPITSRTICELVLKLRDLEKVTSVFVTHDLNTIHILASEVAEVTEDRQVRFVPLRGETSSRTQLIMLEKGRVLIEGTEEALRGSTDPYVREFLD